MKSKSLLFVLSASFIAFTAASKAQAQEVQTAIEICNEAGVCSTVAPEVGAVYFILDALIGELGKDRPFGESNEIRKAIEELRKFAIDGMGPGNDIRKFLEDSGIDHLLQQLGIKLFS